MYFWGDSSEMEHQPRHGKGIAAGRCRRGLLLAALLATGCGQQGEPGIEPNGRVQLELLGKTYEVEVVCRDIAGEHFRFLSDATEAHDTNGDGLVVSGVQQGEQLMLVLVDQGRSYRANRLSSWEKTAAGATGSGMMLEDGTAAPYGVSFRLSCERADGG